MTEAGWTAEVPKEIGVYWWRSNAADNHPWIVRVHKGWLGVMLMQTMGGPLVTIGDGGEWLGPLSPTDRQQGKVEGLREAVEIVKANSDVKKAVEIIRLHALAQPAQDEKGVGDANG